MKNKINDYLARWKRVESIIINENLSRENVIGKALLIRADFKDYIGDEQFYSERTDIAKRKEYLNAFFESVKGLSSENRATNVLSVNVLGRIFACRYLEINYKKDYDEYYRTDCLNVMKDCQEEISACLKLQCNNIVDVTIIFLSAVLCDYDGSLKEDIYKFLSTNISIRNSGKCLNYINDWVIQPEKNAMRPKGEGLGQIDDTAVIGNNDENAKCYIFFYLCKVITTNQMKYYLKRLVQGSAKDLNPSLQKFVREIVYHLIKECRFEEVVFILENYENLYEQLETNFINKSIVETFVLEETGQVRSNSELYLIYLLERAVYNVEKDDDKLKSIETCWKEKIEPVINLSNSRQKQWIQHWYELNRIILNLNIYKNKKKCEEELKTLTEYPFDKEFDIKVVCEKQAEIFSFYIEKGWELDDLIRSLNRNNVFAYNKDKYYEDWPAELISNSDSTVKDNFREKYIERSYIKENGVDKVVELFFNSNMRFVYQIRSFLKDLYSSGVPDWKINKTLNKYRIHARVVVNNPDKRARDKIKVAFYTLNSGCETKAVLRGTNYLTKNLYPKYLFSCDEQWYKKNEYDVWCWPQKQFECYCKLSIIVNKKGKFKETKVKDIGIIDKSLLQEIDLQAEINNMISWLEAIKKEKIVYNPQYYFGNDRVSYIESMNADNSNNDFSDEDVEQLEQDDKLTSKSKIEYHMASLRIPRPSQIEKGKEADYANKAHSIADEVALLIVQVYIALRDNPIKVKKFMVYLEKGIISNINEYSYVPHERSNGEIMEENYTPYDSEVLKKQSKMDLEQLCDKDSQLKPEMIGDIYMNTYLKRYISVVEFFNTLTKATKELKYSDFISYHYRNEDDNRYTFCLSIKDNEKNNKGKTNDRQIFSDIEGDELELFPENKHASEIVWKGESDKKVIVTNIVSRKETSIGCVRASVIDIKDNIVYVDKITPQKEFRRLRAWEIINEELSKFLTRNTSEEIMNQVNEIHAINDFWDLDFFKGTRLQIISSKLLSSFEYYKYDITKCNTILNLFLNKGNRDVNPYKKRNKTIELLRDDKYKYLKGCFKKFVEHNIDVSLNEIFFFYYNTFCYACENWEESMRIIAEVKEMELKDVIGQEFFNCKKYVCKNDNEEFEWLNTVLEKDYSLEK